MGKRLRIARVMSLLGLDVLGAQFNRNLIYIFNYHRVHDRDGRKSTLFDDGVYGPSVSQLKQQLELLQKHTKTLSESDMVKAVRGDSMNNGPYSMVTFDDAYRDNYELALPALLEAGVPAIFFVPTLLIENRSLGWWDKIAFILKNTKQNTICFRDKKVELGQRKGTAIKYFQELMKKMPAWETENLIDELAEVADSPPPSTDLMDRELMDWDQLRRTHEAGIVLGSHTCTHRVLSTLTEEEQGKEINDSKAHIEKKLDIKVRSLAFPVGGGSHFNETTLKLTQRSGYDLAFSLDTVIAKVNPINRYAIPRIHTPSDLERFDALLKFPKLMNH